MRRWSSSLLCGLAGGSLLIFLLAMGIWVRSYFAGEAIFYGIIRQEQPIPGGQVISRVWFYSIHWSRGRAGILRQREVLQGWLGGETGLTYRRWDPRWDYIPARSKDDRIYVNVGDFFLQHTLIQSNVEWKRLLSMALPLWLFGLFAIPPLLWVRRWRRKRGRGGRGFPVEVAEATT